MNRSTKRRLLLASALLLATTLAALVRPEPRVLPRMFVNSAATRATLHQIHDAQERVLREQKIDRDEDGTFEIATIQELCKAAPALTVSGREIELWSEDSPAPLPLSLGLTDGELTVRSGHYFQMWLPAVGGGFLPSHVARLHPRSIDTARANIEWRCYAWPVYFDGTGRAAYAIDARGQVFKFANEGAVFSGRAGPGPEAIERFTPYDR